MGGIQLEPGVIPDPAANPVVLGLESFGAELRRFLSSRAPAAEVDELFQRLALRSIESAPSLADPARVRPWLYRIARRVVSDHHRALRLEAARFSGQEVELAVDPDPAPPARCACVLAWFRELKPNYARMLELVDLEGVSIAAAAALLQISPNNATVRLHRARRVLREALFERCRVRSVRECFDCTCCDGRSPQPG